jgi:hypothetical protein
MQTPIRPSVSAVLEAHAKSQRSFWSEGPERAPEPRSFAPERATRPR